MFQLYLKKEGEKLCLEWKFKLYSFQATISLSVSVQLYSEMVVILAITAIATASTAILALCGLCCPSTKRQVTQEPMRKMLVVSIADTELTGVSYSSNLTVERLRQEYCHGPHSALEQDCLKKKINGSSKLGQGNV